MQSLKDYRKDWTTKELAEKANVSSSYIRQLLIAGEIEGYKLGRDWLVTDREAKKWLNSRET